MELILVSAQANICFLKIKHIGRSQHISSQIYHLQQHAQQWLMRLPESALS